MSLEPLHFVRAMRKLEREHAEAFVARVSPPRLSRPASHASLPGPASSKRATQRQSTASALAEMPRGSLLLYTDGGCTGNLAVATTVQPAGWGVVVLEKRDASGGGEEVRLLTELHTSRPVELS